MNIINQYDRCLDNKFNKLTKSKNIFLKFILKLLKATFYM